MTDRPTAPRRRAGRPAGRNSSVVRSVHLKLGAACRVRAILALFLRVDGKLSVPQTRVLKLIVSTSSIGAIAILVPYT